MKKLKLLLSVVFIAFTANAQNLLINPGFETWSGGVPTGWTLTTTVSGTVNEVPKDSANAFQIAGPTGTYSISQIVLPPNGAATFDTTSIYTFKASYLVTVGDGTDARVWSNLMISPTLSYMPVTHKDSALYYIPFHGPGGNLNPPTGVVGDDMNGYLLDNRTTGIWHTYTYSFKFPAGISQFQYMVRTYKASTVIWDNMFLGQTVVSDTQAPSVPTGLQVTTPTANSFTLSWNASSDNVGVTGYEVYKDSLLYGTTSALGLTINGLVAGRTYRITVKARDAAGNLSATSTPMLFTAQPGPIVGVTLNVTVPVGTNQCWIVGSYNGWNNNLNQMTKVDNTHYTITLDVSSFPAGITRDNMEYKYCSGGGDWAFVEKYTDGSEMLLNRKYADSNGIDVVLRWGMVYDPSILPLPMNVTINVKTPSGTNECYIVGNFNNWNGPTASPDSCRMIKVSTNGDGTIVFQKRIFTPDANKLVYHFCSGPDWSFEQSSPVGDYKYPDILPIVSGWKAVYDPSKTGKIHITATVPAGTKNVWIQGSYLGWDMTRAVPGIKNPNGTFSFSVPNIWSIEYRLFNKPDWGFSEIDVSGNDRVNRSAAYPVDSITNITVLGWKQQVVDSISDIVAPSAPTGLKNTVPTTNSFYLSWNASTDNVAVTGYNVYKDSVLYGSTSLLGMDINGLTPGTTYCMTVKAKDAAGNISVASLPLYVFDPKTGVTYNVTVPSGTKVCYIAGTMNGWTQKLMSKVDETHYGITISTAQLTDKYKYCSGPDWLYVEKDLTGAEISDRSYSEHDVVASWASIYDPAIQPIEKDVLIQVIVPDYVLQCYLVGTFNNWAGPVDSTKMTKGVPADGKVVFSKTIHTMDANSLQFKFCAGPTWTYLQTEDPVFVYPAAEASVTVTVNSFKKIFDPTKTGTFHINATVPSGTQKVWIQGSFLGWDMNKVIEGTKNPNGTFSFIVANEMYIEYRLYNQPDWNHSEVGAAEPLVDLPNRLAFYPTDSITNITVWGWKQSADSISRNGISVQFGTGGTVFENSVLLSTGDFITVNQGAIKTFTIQPNAGFKVETIYYNNLNVKSQLVNNQFTTPTVNGSSTLYVTFQKIQYRLSIKSAESGTVSLLCEYGATPSFEFSPSPSWRINTVIFNGMDVTSSLTNDIFMIPPVTGDILLNISFEFLTSSFTPSSNSNIKVYPNNSEIVIEGVPAGEIIRLYSENGAQLKVIKSQGNRMVIPAQPDAIYLVNIATKTVKVIL